MFKWLESRLLWGSLLIVGGVLFLLQNLFSFSLGGLFWGVVFALGGLFFLTVFLQNRLYWWALIPGFTLFGIAALILVSWLAPGFGEVWGGALVLGGIGAGFLVIFLLNREHWWALIPAGVLLTLAVVSTFDAVTSSTFDTGGLFFLGLGLTFALVALVPTQHGQMSWAWIPAGIMGLMGMFILASSNGIAGYLWPAVLIAGGALLVLRAWRPRAG